MRYLETLWFQVAGTLCNLRCAHCFISCSPDNHHHDMMTLEQVRGYLDEAAGLGVREYYFTGGEPFMNREMLAILEVTLRLGPATVLTNGLFFDAGTCGDLRRLADGSDYSLDLRVSLDGWGPEDNDRIRGQGTWERVAAGLRNLSAAGLDPVITITEAADGVGATAGRARCLDRLRELGLTRPRLKVLPLFRLGAESRRTHPYGENERLTPDMVTAADLDRLQCSTGRMITSKGVYVCPILIEEPAARMGTTIAETLRPFDLRYGACHTCHVRGVTCTT